MKTIRRRQLCVIALTLPCTLAHAEFERPEGLALTASESLLRDSNLYRLADGVDPQRGERSDWISVTRLGAEYERRFGLQQVAASLGLSASRYRDNGHLDHEGVDAGASWRWAVGRRMSGGVALRQSQALSGFDDFAGQERSINTYRRLEMFGDFALTPRWFAGAGAAYTSSDYSGDTRPTADYRARSLSMRGGYQGRSSERLVLSLMRTQGEYPNRVATIFSDQSYSQNDYRLDGYWPASGATRLSGYLGYMTRSYDFAVNRDFEGAVGRLEMDWRISGKLSLQSQLRREIGAQEDLVDNYVVTDALALRPKWALSEKINVSSELEYRRRDFGGDPGFLPQDQRDRTEHLRSLGVAADYRPSQLLSLGMSLRWQTRSADGASRDYDATTAGVSARLRF